jgi:hypothetical protein
MYWSLLTNKVVLLFHQYAPSPIAGVATLYRKLRQEA